MADIIAWFILVLVSIGMMYVGLRNGGISLLVAGIIFFGIFSHFLIDSIDDFKGVLK